jgi:hypothetical protein
MLVNESFFDFFLCIICYLLIALDFSYVLFLDLLAFCSTFVLCFFLFVFASRSCLWPLLLFQLSFCRSRFLSLALVFGLLSFYFCFSFLIYGFYLAFGSLFLSLIFFSFGSYQVLIFHFFLSFFTYGWKHTTMDQRQQMWCS